MLMSKRLFSDGDHVKMLGGDNSMMWWCRLWTFDPYSTGAGHERAAEDSRHFAQKYARRRIRSR
jgi:hypothetical protein